MVRLSYDIQLQSLIIHVLVSLVRFREHCDLCVLQLDVIAGTFRLENILITYVVSSSGIVD